MENTCISCQVIRPSTDKKVNPRFPARQAATRTTYFAAKYHRFEEISFKIIFKIKF